MVFSYRIDAYRIQDHRFDLVLMVLFVVLLSSSTSISFVFFWHYSLLLFVCHPCLKHFRNRIIYCSRPAAQLAAHHRVSTSIDVPGANGILERWRGFHRFLILLFQFCPLSLRLMITSRKHIIINHCLHRSSSYNIPPIRSRFVSFALLEEYLSSYASHHHQHHRHCSSFAVTVRDCGASFMDKVIQKFELNP